MRRINATGLQYEFCQYTHDTWLLSRGPKFVHFSAAGVRAEAISHFHGLHLFWKSDFTFFYINGFVPSFLNDIARYERRAAYPFEAPLSTLAHPQRATRQWTRSLADGDASFRSLVPLPSRWD